MNIRVPMSAVDILANQALKFTPDIAEDVLADITGVRVHKPENVPYYGPDERVNGTPALKLRRSETPGGLGVWGILDYLDPFQHLVLGLPDRRVRISTDCREDDLAGAARKLIDYEVNKRARLAARVVPEAIPIAAILMTYHDHLDHGDHSLAAATFHAYLRQMVPLMEYFGRAKLGQITGHTLKNYENCRRVQPNSKKPGEPISTTEIGHEIATFRQAFNYFCRITNLQYTVHWYRPDRDTPKVIYWERDEIARYLWACRGRVWLTLWDKNGKPTGGRWRIKRDDDPSLDGPDGDKRVLRENKSKRQRKVEDPNQKLLFRREAETRRVLSGVYTASRHQVLLDTAWLPGPEGPYVSLAEQQIYRREIGPETSDKRRPPVLLSDKMQRFMTNWCKRDMTDEDVERGRFQPALTVLHLPDGSPCTSKWMRNTQESVLADCGVLIHRDELKAKGGNDLEDGDLAREAKDFIGPRDPRAQYVPKPINSNILRHTAAVWLKTEWVSPWLIGEFLGCSPEVVVERYGTFDDHTPSSSRTSWRGAARKRPERRRSRIGD